MNSRYGLMLIVLISVTATVAGAQNTRAVGVQKADDALRRLEAGQEAYWNAQFDLALQHIRKSLETGFAEKEHRLRAYEFLALTYLGLGQTTMAEYTFSQLLAQEPDYELTSPNRTAEEVFRQVREHWEQEGGIAGFTTVSGQVIDATTGEPVAGAAVEIAGLTTETDSRGRWTVTGIPAGGQELRVQAEGYEKSENGLVLVAAEEHHQTVGMIPDRFGDNTNLLVCSEPPGAEVKVDGKPVWWRTEGGKTKAVTPCLAPRLEPGTHKVVVTRDKYKPGKHEVQLAEGETVRHDFALVPRRGGGGGGMGIAAVALGGGAVAGLAAGGGGGGGGGNPPAGDFSISGTVTDRHGNGFESVQVQCEGYSYVTGVSGEYHLTSIRSGTHTVTPRLSGYVFDPSSRNVTVTNDDLTGVDFTALVYSLSGTVVDDQGNPVENVEVSTAFGSGTTDATGSYEIKGVPPGEHTVTPSRDEWEFTPSARDVTVDREDVSDLDFTGTMKTYTVSGTVSDEHGSPVEGVLLSAAGESGTSDADGRYTITGLTAGSHTVSPTMEGWSFQPNSQSVDVGGTDGDATDVDFTAGGYSVSGQITTSDTPPTPIEGVSVSLSPGNGTATTDTDGNYSIRGLFADSYEVTPNIPNWEMMPPSRTVEVQHDDMTGVNFLASQTVFTLSGTVYDSDGSGISGTTVTVGDQSAVTDDGRYSVDLTAGTYRVRPSLSGETFIPSTREVVVDETVAPINVAPLTVAESGKPWVKWVKPEFDIWGALAVGSDGTAYACTGRHGWGLDLSALSAEGEPLFSIPGCQGEPVVGPDGRVYAVFEMEGQLYLVALSSDGHELWRQSIGDAEAGLPALACDGTIYVGGDTDLIAVSPDGTIAWRYTVSGYVLDAPAVGPDGTVHLAASDGCVYAINPDGTLRWRSSIAGTVECLSIGADGALYVCADQFHAIASDGVETWQLPDAASGALVGAEGTIYLFGQETVVTAVSPDGVILWTSEVRARDLLLGSHGTLYACQGNYGELPDFHALDESGAIEWSWEIGGYGALGMTLGPNGTIYLAKDHDGPSHLLAFGIVDEIPQLADAPWPTRRHDSRRTGCLCGDATPSIASASATTLVSSPACCATEGGGAQVSFTLSADAAVTADVMNIAGRRIGHIVQDRELQAGANTLLWDGRSTRGLAVPAGMYLIRLTARDAEGGQSRSIGSLRLTR